MNERLPMYVMALCVVPIASPVQLAGRAQTPASAAVYEAILAHGYPDGLPAVIVVEDALVPLPPMHGPDAQWLHDAETVPFALRRQTGSPNQPSAALDDNLFPAQVRLMSRADIQAMFTAGIEEGWATFRRSTGADGWHAFTHVIFANDGRDALVYHEHRCGGLCGEGRFVWLQRESMAAPWVVRQRVLRWIA